MNLFTKQKQTHSHRKQLPEEKGKVERYKLGVWDYQIQTTIYNIDKQQGPNVQHRDLQSISYDKT